jgi:two-component system OmpR family sensor kinase
MTLRARLVLAIAATTLLSLVGVAGGLRYAAANVPSDRALAWATVIAVGAALAWSVLVTSWIVEGLTSDHRAIASAVRAFAAGDRRVRTNIRTGDPEVNALARDIDAMMDDLSRALEIQRRFAANAAHELRSPLTTLHGELSLALRRDRSAEDYKTAISHALEAATDLRGLAEDLLDLARTDAKRVTRADLVDMTALVTKAAARRVVVDVGDDPLLVRGDARDLERLLSNLIENAQRHAATDAQVVVTALRKDDAVEIAVLDDGVGVTASDAERIFEPFERGASGSREGSGLGLSICKSIALAHGGSIGVDTERERGSRFVVTLPRV